MLQPPPPRVTHSNKEASSWTPVHSVLVWPWLIEAAVPWSRSLDLGVKMCYSVVNNYLSAGRNRFDLESGPWTIIRATSGKETLYQVPIKFAHWRLKSTWFCPVVLSRLAGTCVADDAYLVQARDISYFVATWWRGWFILVRHSNKKRDNVAKSRPGSNTAYRQSINFFMVHALRKY